MQIRGDALVATKLLHRVSDQSLNVPRRVTHVIGDRNTRTTVGHHNAKITLVLLQLFILIVELKLDVGIVPTGLDYALLQIIIALVIRPKLLVARVHFVRTRKLALLHSERGERLLFNPNGVHSVLTIQKLNDTPVGSSQRAIVAGHDGLHRLHKSALDVTGLRRLTGRINQTLPSSHGVEKELLCGETSQIAILDETPTLGPEIVLHKMWQSTLLKTEGDPLSLDSLLADTGDNLRDIDVGTLGSGRNHRLDTVPLCKTLLGALTTAITRSVKSLLHVSLERLHHGLAGLHLQFPRLRLLNQRLHAALGLVNLLLDINHSLLVSNCVDYPNAKGFLEDPVIGNLLSLVEKAHCLLETDVEPTCVNKATHTASNRLLVNDAAHQLPVGNDNFTIIQVHGVEVLSSVNIFLVRMSVPLGLQVDLWTDKGKHLFPTPQWLGLQDTRIGNMTVPICHPHEDVHHHILLNKYVALRHLLCS